MNTNKIINETKILHVSYNTITLISYVILEEKQNIPGEGKMLVKKKVLVLYGAILYLFSGLNVKTNIHYLPGRIT